MSSFLIQILNRFPAAKARLKTLRDRCYGPASVSSHYVEITEAERENETRRLASSWKEEQLPTRQRVLVEGQLRDYRNGKRIDVFDVLIEALDATEELPKDATVLEIGCSSGYYSEVLAIAGKGLVYEGCDYSESFISLARSIYPDVHFEVEDATKLSYPDERFNVVVSGCCLLHIPDYATAIAEAARVAKDYVIFHRTPVVLGRPTRYFRKQAYGVETVEIHFSEDELLGLFANSGLVLLKTVTLYETRDPADPSSGSAGRTYLCRKSIKK